MSRTLEQKRAADAYQKVKQLEREKDTDFKKSYASYAESLPATILANGLGQAAATLLAAAKGKDEDAHLVLYKHLETWLCREDSQAPYPGAGDLMEAIIDRDRDAYLHAQAEALAWLTWLKKFASAFLKPPEGDSE